MGQEKFQPGRKQIQVAALTFISPLIYQLAELVWQT